MVHRKHASWARTLLFLLAALLLATGHANAIGIGCVACKDSPPETQGQK